MEELRDQISKRALDEKMSHTLPSPYAHDTNIHKLKFTLPKMLVKPLDILD